MSTLLKLLVIFIGLNIFGCGTDDRRTELEFYPIGEQDFQKFVNKKALRSETDLAKDIHIVNNDYPFEISFYDDGTWYYNLENLGDGKGTWEYKGGRLELFAQRVLFDMYIEVESADDKGSALVIKFADRNGPKKLFMENRNLK